MTQSGRIGISNWRPSRSKLGWLVLIWFIIATPYFYFKYSSLSPKTIRSHSSSDASGPTPSISNSVTAISSHKDEITEASELTQSGEVISKSAIEDYSKVNKGRPLVFEEISMKELESDDPDMNTKFSTSEFGVVFADQEPNDNDGVELTTGEILWKQDDKHNSLKDVSSEPTQAMSEIGHLLPSTALQHHTNISNPNCVVETQFHSWEKGMVTQLGKPLKRDCHKLRMNLQGEVKNSKIQSQVTAWKLEKPWESFALEYKNKDCISIRHEFENNFYVSEVERDFPIAYILVVYTNAGQVIRLLKSIYRPHNLYCIHPDARQGEIFANFFKAITKCLDNVFIVSKPVRVYYGHISITDSQLHCMQDLMTYPATRWKYVINLSGREVPLKTNREIIESLKKLKGYTALDIGKMTSHFLRTRFKFKFHLDKNGCIKQTHQHQSRPPPGIKLYKSLTFLAASRAFVDFLLNNPLAVKFHSFLSTVYAPEEHFYSSLYALPQAKGARPPKGAIKPSDMPIVNEVIWTSGWKKKKLKFYCPGRRIMHKICILTASDLGWIEKTGICSTQPVFFFNKYFLEWDPTAMDCMEERLVTTNIDEYWHDCVDTVIQRLN